MRLPVNLAAKPFRNERLPGALVLLLGLVAIAGTALHIVEIRRLVGRQATAMDEEAHALEAELANAEAEVAAAQQNPPASERLARWAEIQGVVDRRAFAWTTVLSAIERTLPRSVRVTSLTPKVEKGALAVDIVASARDADAAFEMLEAFRGAQEFVGALPTNIGDQDGEVSIAMTVGVRMAAR